MYSILLVMGALMPYHPICDIYAKLTSPKERTPHPP